MKEIKLSADKPFHNNVDVSIIDFPDGLEGRERRRCKITVDFAESDVRQLKQQGMDFDDAMTHYEEWLYAVVKLHIAQDWKCISGYEQVVDIIKDHVKLYY